MDCSNSSFRRSGFAASHPLWFVTPVPQERARTRFAPLRNPKTLRAFATEVQCAADADLRGLVGKYRRSGIRKPQARPPGLRRYMAILAALALVGFGYYVVREFMKMALANPLLAVTGISAATAVFALAAATITL